MTYPDQLIDKRVIDRNIAKGLVDRKEYDKHLTQLSDVADNIELVRVDEDDADEDMDDESAEHDEHGA